MGIKGIYKEIGAGTRIALLRLAVESLETRGRPLRLAIDVSIWQFQVQAAKGGSNPAIRTLFYRLVRLLGMPVQPVFVFDGLNKPLFKRNKRSGPGDGTGMASAMAKRMIRMFGFCVHDAPGEAEAECALLQQRGVVDAVLSEDVDTLMFGCTRTLRNWSAATATTSGKGSTSATVTHVSMYEAEAEAAASSAPAAVMRTSETGLDREGLVLVALMSGGDYLPEGVPGCGVKLACEAARAGFGRTLCRIKRADAAALAQWRAELQHELRTNEHKFFRTCHHKLVIPDDFPNLDVLRYYTHPVVSPADVVERLRADLDARPVSLGDRVAAVATAAAAAPLRRQPIDILGLRDFVAETFDWSNRIGAVKFVRVLAPGLLARTLLLGWSSDATKDGDDDRLVDEDVPSPPLVEGISRQRTHASTDDIPEVRVSFVPATVVGLDLDAELDVPEASFGRDGLALNSDDEFDEPPPTAPLPMSMLPPPPTSTTSLTVASARKAAAGAAYDPTVPSVAWIPRAVVQIGAPGALQEWDQRQQRGNSKKKAAADGNGTGATKGAPGRRRKPPVASSDMQAGALDRFVKVTKSTSGPDSKQAEVRLSQSQSVTFKAPLDHMGGGEEEADNSEDDCALPAYRAVDEEAVPPSPAANRRPAEEARPPPGRRKGGNPWTFSRPVESSAQTPRVTKNTSQQRKYTRPAAAKEAGVIDLVSSSPAAAQKVHSPSASGGSGSSPAKPHRSAATRTSLKRAAVSSPQKQQTSIRSFLSSSQSQAPFVSLLSSSPPPPLTAQQRRRPAPEMTIALSDDEETDAATADEPLSLSGKEEPVAEPIAEPVAEPAAPATKKAPKKRYVPRTSAVGYFREETVDDGEQDRDGAAAGAVGQRSRRWRHSEIGVVDLTGIGR